jgi:RNA polymerase sigma-70 factor (ECF subfamily)
VNGGVTPELLGRLLDEHGGALALFAAQWTEAADDCVQEALIELARQPRLPASPVAWLYRVVRNRAISQFRSAARRERREQLVARLRVKETGSHDDAGRRDVNSESADAEELAAATASLPEELREVVVARTWSGLNFDQIAELVGCSTSTAHRRYEAGLAALRQRLERPCHTKTNTTA